MKLKQFLIKLIDFYRKFLSPFKFLFIQFGIFQNVKCVFYPTCSDYTKQAINKYGVLKGLWLGFYRILRCNPWQKNHIDILK